MLLYNELPTAFPWYDKIGKQQRHRENAAKMCDYRLLNPRDRLLPFQLKLDYLKGNNIVDMENDIVHGEYLGVNGTMLEDEDSVRTGYIAVTEGEEIHFRVGMIFGVLCAFFDSSYQFISDYNTTQTTLGSIAAPPGASYVVFNVSSVYERQNALFTEGRISTVNTTMIGEGWRRTSITNFDNMHQIDENEEYFYTGEIIDMSPSAGSAGVSIYDEAENFINSQHSDIKIYRKEPVSIPSGTRYLASCSYRRDPIVEKKVPKREAYNMLLFSLSKNEIPETISPGDVSSWVIKSLCGTEIDISINTGALSTAMYSDGIRVFYNGSQLYFRTNTGDVVLKIPEGSYYSILEFQNGDTYFSEVFTVPEDGLENYMKIEFWNSCDIAPIAYNNGAGGWKQTMYIDSFIHASDPEVEEDGERDGNDMLIPTFQRMVVRYRFSAVVPDYMKIAIVSLQLHDNVWITTENETRSGRADRLSTSTSIDDNGAYSTIDAIIDQYVMVKKACCSNIDLIDMS